MMQAIEYSIVDVSGKHLEGNVALEEGVGALSIRNQDKISLHLDQSHIFAMLREGSDLVIVFLDGGRLVISDYFDCEAELFISADGLLNQVVWLDEVAQSEGNIDVSYTLIDVDGKWHPLFDLVFVDELLVMEPVTAVGPMVVPLGGLVGGGLGASALFIGGGAREDADPILPTVNNPEAKYILTTNTLDRVAVVSGTGEPGSTVNVALGEKSIETAIGSKGTWVVEFDGEKFPADGDLTSAVTVESPSGTTYFLDGPDFLIDMTPPILELVSGVVSVSDVENAAEHRDGVTVAGKSDPGASIAVEVAGNVAHTTASADGTFAVNFSRDQLPEGTYQKLVTVTAVDNNGNISRLTDAIAVDTEVEPFAYEVNSANTDVADGIVNAVEAERGLVISGQVEAGSTVSVQFNKGPQMAADVVGTSWSVTIPPNQLPMGEITDLELIVTAVDANSNVATQVGFIDFDTKLGYLTTGKTIAGDNVVNATEAAQGFSISGSAEIGSDVFVTLANGITRSTTSDTAGNWTVTFDGKDLGSSVGTMTYTVAATDPAGNDGRITDTSTQKFSFDLSPPSAPVITDKIDGEAATTGLLASSSEASQFTVAVIDPSGAVTNVNTLPPVSVGTKDLYSFSSEVPHGSYIIVTDSDPAGNTASTLLIVNGNSDVTVDLERIGFNQFNLSSINLEHAQNSLTISAEQVARLTGTDNTLIISGDANDSITALNALDTGKQLLIGGQQHSVYSIGDSGTLLVLDDQITNLTV